MNNGGNKKKGGAGSASAKRSKKPSAAVADQPELKVESPVVTTVNTLAHPAVRGSDELKFTSTQFRDLKPKVNHQRLARSNNPMGAKAIAFGEEDLKQHFKLPKREILQSLGGSDEVFDEVWLLFCDNENCTREKAIEYIAEVDGLLNALGLQITDLFYQKRRKPDIRTFMGEGRVEQVQALLEEHKKYLFVCNQEISPGQLRNLEKELKHPVIDRTTVILDIFAQNARTRESKIKVEIARLEFMKPRLTRLWAHLGRQKGGIGQKGEGEKQIELDRRMILRAISIKKKELEDLVTSRDQQRQRRSEIMQVSLVGYTNAGKSTLLNRLTHSNELVQNQVFSTLDTRVRILNPDSRPRVLLKDTVGFIRKLPHHLVSSFRSTLEEIRDSNLIVHVVDLSNPFYEEHIQVCEEVLADLGMADVPHFIVFNKADLISSKILPKLVTRNYVKAIQVSAFDEESIDRLRNAIINYFEDEWQIIWLRVPYQEKGVISYIYQQCKILQEHFQNDAQYLQVKIRPESLGKLKNYILDEPDQKLFLELLELKEE